MSTALFPATDVAPKAVPSGAHLGPEHTTPGCDGHRTWRFPERDVPGHCGCPLGRRLAERDYAGRHKSEVAS